MSKSLKHETVVCTSMILYIFALERKTNKKMLIFEKNSMILPIFYGM